MGWLKDLIDVTEEKWPLVVNQWLRNKERRELIKWAKKFFGFAYSPPKQIEIILPGVKRAREPSLVCINYPRFNEELAPDDVYTAIEVYSLLKLLYPNSTIDVKCHTTLDGNKLHSKSLRVVIGGAPTNQCSQHFLQYQPYHYDGCGYTIIGPENQKYDVELTLENETRKIVDKLTDIEKNYGEQTKFISEYISRLPDQIRNSNDVNRFFETIKKLLRDPLAQNTTSAKDPGNVSLDSLKRKCEKLGNSITRDFAFVSRLWHEGESYDVILSGCRAYGQLAFFHDLLKRPDFYKKILKPGEQELVKGNVQAILPIRVSGKQNLEWEKENTIVHTGLNANWK